MKTLSKILLILFIGVMAFYACDDETFTEEDAINAIKDYEEVQDSINDGNTLVADSLSDKDVVLTIKVVNASGNFATKGYSGATVTITRDGETVSETTGTDGSASFSGLQEGNYAVNVTATGFTTVDFITEFDQYNGYYSVQVPILSTTTNLMTVTGTVTFENDLLNTTRENVDNQMVVVQPNLPDYFGNIPGVEEIAYSGYADQTFTNASGVFTIDVPADMAGELNYDIFVPEFEATQTLMLNEVDGVDVTGPGNGAQSITTRFGTELSGSESPVPAVNPVYCVFSNPTHTLNPATLTVETDNDYGVHKAYVTDEGANYGGDDPYITITNTNTTTGNDARARLHVHDHTGQVEWIEITNNGNDFPDVPTLNLDFIQVQCAIEVLTVDAGTGEILTVDISNDGSFLTDQITVSGGTGNSATFDIEFDGTTYYVNAIDDGGEDYTAGDELIAVAPTTTAAGMVTMETPYISSIQVTDDGDGYEINTTYDVIFSYGDAAATAYTDAYGRVYRVEVTDQSYNYETVPTATVDYKLFNKTATADVFVQEGEVKSVFNLDGGAGYDNLPTVTFYYQYDTDVAVSGIDYDVAINGGDPYNVTSLSINQGGASIQENLATKQGDAAKNNVKSIPGATIYADFYLGTGVRTAGN